MRAFTAIKRIKLLVVLSLFLVSGCAQNAYSVQENSVPGSNTVTLRDIIVSGEGYQSKIEISTDKPVTYTSYSLKGPNRTIIDLSGTRSGTATVPQLASNSLIKKIELTSIELSGGVLTRLTVETSENVEFVVANDPTEKTKLLVSIPTQSTPENAVATVAEISEVATPNYAVDAVALAATDLPGRQEDAPAKVAVAEPSSVQNDVSTAAASEPTLSSLEVTDAGIVITTGSSLDKYKYFQLSSPQRLVVDLYNVKNSIVNKSVPIKSFGIENARLGSYPDKIRIVFDSQEKALQPFTIEKTDSGLLVGFAKQETAIVQPVVSTSGNGRQSGSSDATAVKKASSVEAIDFKVLDDVSRIEITLDGECNVVGPTKTSDGLVLTFSKCLLPKKLQRPFDTSAFASNVLKITPYQITTKGHKDTRIQVSLRESSSFTLKNDGSVYSLDIVNPAELSPVSSKSAKQAPVIASGVKTTETSDHVAIKQPEMKKPLYVQDETDKQFGKKVYTGKRVTLEFADADIRKIFQLIAEVSNLNILVGDDVSGTISIKLVNVPWDQALDVILETKGLGMKREGNIVLIKPKDKIVSLADEQLAATRAYERTLDLRTRVFDINFASVTDVAGQFQSFKSERGTISIDSRTNRVIVNDVQPAIEKMANLLKALDIPEKQVLIEARIIEASSTFTQDLGVQWGIHYKDGSASTLGINSLDTGFGGAVTNIAPTSGLPAAASAGGALGLSFGKLGSNVQVDLRLSAAAETGQVKIISTPKVVTLNNKSAKISQGQMIPYFSTSAEGTKTEFVEAALTLEVTPHITADGSVSMKIKASNNSAGNAGQNTAPPINKKEATTELLVQSGETTVIGGIYVDSDTSTDSGVPFLMDIPILGWLFKSNNQKKTKSELLIFITPKIVN